jgi:hypothetical protein
MIDNGDAVSVYLTGTLLPHQTIEVNDKVIKKNLGYQNIL